MKQTRNPRRSEEQMCSDLAFVLNSSLHEDTKRSVLDSILWTWTTRQGKYDGCHWWSPDANTKHLRTGNFKDLRHEHVVPRSELRKMLMKKLRNLTPEEIHRILSTFCLAIIVTKEEDAKINKIGLRSKMPDDWNGENPWARYVVAGIENEPQRR